MENIVRTVYGAALQTALLLNRPHQIVQYTTLNEKFGVLPTALPNLNDRLAMRYLTVGNGGHRMRTGANQLTKPDPVQHRATDAALYNHIPLVLRLPEEDLTQADRAKYALRREETHQGRRYYAYYAKRLDVSDAVVRMLSHIGDAAPTPFVPTSANLSPTPPDLNNQGVNVTTGEYVSASALVNLLLGEVDVNELLNVSRIMYEDEGYAIISEMGLCSGVDRMTEVPGQGSSSFDFLEAIAVQCVSFVATFFPMNIMNNGVNVALELGATEPLLKLEGVTP